MEIDAREVCNGSQLEADLCIIGAGPAGLTVAHSFLGRAARVVVIESGGRGPDPAAQALNRGTTTDPAYLDPELTRRRQAGGTARDWNTAIGSELGAKYVPLDPIDFEERDWIPGSGWPIDRRELDPYYDKAREICNLGPATTYRSSDWTDQERAMLPLGGTRIATDIYRYGLARPFIDTRLDDVRAASNVVLCLHGTVVELATAGAGRAIAYARVRCLTGTGFLVRARVFVVAAGAIENARVLLLSTDACPDGLGNEHGLVGRYLMDHPRDYSLALIPADSTVFDRAGFYDVHSTPGGFVMGRLVLTAECRRRERLLSGSATLRPRPPGYRSDGMQALRALRASSLRRPASVLRATASVASRLRDVVGYGYRRYALGYEVVDAGWSLLPDKVRRFSTFELLLNLEQAPDPNNRVTLGTARDALGQPRPHLVWRWMERDQHSLERFRHILAEDLSRAGIGRIIPVPETALDPNAHHHLGTTRMHRDPRRGVADENGRLHSSPNVFVAGSSVFPTGGCANPTLTIVALAIRLGEALQRVLAD